MKIFRTKNFLIKLFFLTLILLGIVLIGKTPFVKATTTKTIIVNFATTPSTATVSKAQLKYNKNFALSYSFDDGLDDGYDPAFKYMFGGYSTYLGQYFGGLYFTDGAGNNVPFRGGYAFYTRNSSYSDIHVNTPSYINWTQLQDAVDNGWDVFNHGYTSASVPANDPNKVYYIGDPGGHAEGPLDYAYELLRFNVDIGSRINLKNNAGATTGAFQSTQVILPNGDENYIQPAFDNNFKAVYAQNPTFTFDGSTTTAPDYTSVNTSISSNRHVMPRWFDYETRYLEGGQYPGELFNHVDTLASMSTGATKYWSQEFTHQITTSTYPGDWSGGITWNSWKSLMDHIENTYGRFGNDTAWVAGAQEVYEYMMVKQNTVLSQNLVGNQLEVTLDITNVPAGLRHYALSLLVSSDAQISSIDYGSNFTSYTDNKTTGLINVDWGVNTYSANDITRVESLVTTAESLRTLSSINIARTYTNLLGNVSQKNAYNARLDAIVVPLRTWYVKIKGDFTSATNANSFSTTTATYSPSPYNWNKFGVVKDSTIIPAGNDLVNLKDADGLVSDVSISNTAPFKYGSLGSSSTGNNSGLYPDAVISGSAQIYASSTTPAKIKIYGLNDIKNYNIKLFGNTSATGKTGDSATTQYTIGGVVKELYVRENVSNYVQFTNIVPVNGEIEITINPKVASWGYGMLNAMEIVENLLPAPTNLSYTSPNVYTKNSAITPLSPTVTGIEVSYSISPELPTGLSFDTSSGVISGTPTVVYPRATHTVTATNTGGSTTFGILITVNDIAPSSLSYTSPNTFTKNSAITPLSPTITGTPVSYSVSPDLPTGLLLDTSTGVISGTPTAVANTSTYTVTATNTGGSTTFGVSITVNDIAPSSLSYTSPNTFTKNSAITPLNPTSSGGTPTSYSVSPSLPEGLSLNTSTGVISGTPTSISSQATYTITATNSVGSTTFGILITVNDIAPSSLSYTSPNTFTKNSAITPLSPTITGTPVSYSVSPDLPTGLLLDTSTGVISGTPTAVANTSTYTVTATNTGGSTTFGVSITVNASVSNISDPVASPVAGTYNTTQSVILTAEGSTTIRYSTTSIPENCSSGTLYSSPISITTSETIYVRACDIENNSSTGSFAYTISSDNETSTYMKYSTTSMPANCSSGTLYSDSITFPANTKVYIRVCNSLNNTTVSTFEFITPRSGSGSGSRSGYISSTRNNNLLNTNALLPKSVVPVDKKNVETKENISKNLTPSYLSVKEITKDLKFGMKNNKDVKILQLFLIKQNKGPNAKALSMHGSTNNFGLLTKNALKEWQKANGVPATGNFGPKTRAKIKLLNL